MIYEDYIETVDRMVQRINSIVTFNQFKTSLNLLEELYELSKQVNVDPELGVKEKERARKKIWDAISTFYTKWIDSAMSVEEFYEIDENREQDYQSEKLPLRKSQEIRSYLHLKLSDRGLRGDYRKFLLSKEMEKIKMDSELRMVLETYLNLKATKSDSTVDNIRRYLFPFLKYLADSLGVEVLTLDDLSIERAQTIPINFIHNYMDKIKEKNREVLRRKLRDLEEWYREQVRKLQTMLDRGMISKEVYQQRLKDLVRDKVKQEETLRQQYNQIHFGSQLAIINTLNPFRRFLLNNTRIKPFGELEKSRQVKEYEEEKGQPRRYNELVQIFLRMGERPKKIPEVRWETFKLFAKMQLQSSARPGQLLLLPAGAILGEISTKEMNNAFGEPCVGIPARAAVIRRLKFEGRPPAVKPMPDYWFVTEETYSEIADFVESQGFNGLQAPFKTLFGNELKTLENLYAHVDMSPYDLRKTWATVVWRLTGERKVLQEYGGWREGMTGVTEYAHLWTDEEALKTAEDFKTFIPETEAGKIEKVRERIRLTKKEEAIPEKVAVSPEELRKVVDEIVRERIDKAVKEVLGELLSGKETSKSLIEEIKKKLGL